MKKLFQKKVLIFVARYLCYASNASFAEQLAIETGMYTGVPKYRHTGKILECAVHQIKVITCPTYTRVCMESWQYRIFESLGMPHCQLHSQCDSQ